MRGFPGERGKAVPPCLRLLPMAGKSDFENQAGAASGLAAGADFALEAAFLRLM